MLKKKLRIAVIASNVIKVPPFPPDVEVPPGWSGAPELIVYCLTEELVKRGHAVTLFASGDSETSAKLVSVNEKSTWKMGILDQHIDYEYTLISKAYQMAQNGDFDIIHSHFDTRTAYFAPLVKTPTISTLHSRLKKEKRTVLRNFTNTQYYASISNDQRALLPELNYVVTAYNGIDVSQIPFSDKKEDYLVIVGRISHQKGIAEAIKIAKKLNKKLYIFGSADKTSDYWKKEIYPEIDGEKVIYMDMVSRQVVFNYLKHAQAFIFPLNWEEPFGLVAVEAMACGTPVVTLSRGSMPEIVENGKTGFVVNSIDEMIDMIDKAKGIDPSYCRKRVEDLYTVAKMVDRYEDAYKKILKI